MTRSSRALLLALVAFAVAAPAGAQAAVVVNEIDYDQPGNDMAEFVELRNNGASAVDLDPYALRLQPGG